MKLGPGALREGRELQSEFRADGLLGQGLRLLELSDGRCELTLGGGEAPLHLLNAPAGALHVTPGLAQPLFGNLELSLGTFQAVIKIDAVDNAGQSQHQHDQGEITGPHQPGGPRLHHQPVAAPGPGASIEHLHAAPRPDVLCGPRERVAVDENLHLLIPLAGLGGGPDTKRTAGPLEFTDHLGPGFAV